MLYSRNTSDVRYVESAIDKILHELYGMGIPASRLRAKVFGGAEMFRGNHDEIRLARIVGDGNIKAAKDVLNTHAISIVSECVGGNSGRKLVFDSVTGVVFLRRLSHNSAVPIAAFCKSA
jgi:chemotaxis protein CheD